MGIAPYKTFTFDGTSSSAYGVYLTGEGVFNAPVRAVEMIEIPGRNGNFALDQGRFENITVTYQAGMYDVNESNFADKMSALRNWLCSKVGYCRLEDEYNANEYRMAVYASGLEVSHDMLIAGEFEITFECKPQRWLTSGETETAVANNGTLSNPTSFESYPLLAVKGYGDISFNGYSINIGNVSLGYIPLNKEINEAFKTSKTVTIPIDTALLNNGNTVTVPSIRANFSQEIKAGYTISSITGSYSGLHGNANSNDTSVTLLSDPFTFSWGTTGEVFSGTFTRNVTYVYGGVTTTNTSTSSIKVKVYSSYIEVIFALLFATCYTNKSTSANIPSIMVDSTASGVGNPTYIDCDIGECYRLNGDDVISLNHLISLGSDLPKLAIGTNTFTYDNTVTELKVQPRWWKV